MGTEIGLDGVPQDLDLPNTMSLCMKCNNKRVLVWRKIKNNSRVPNMKLERDYQNKKEYKLGNEKKKWVFS